VKNPAAGGGRWIEVPPERLVPWITEFARRHGGPLGVSRAPDGATVTFTAPDGATAECHPPFPPVPPSPPASASPQPDPEAAAAALAAHALADRTVGVLLVRLGGYAVGVFSGSPPQLVSSKAGSRLVHGRSAAGGWSQHRFARRRENQAATALRATADAAAGIFGAAGRLDALVLGGDRRAILGLPMDVSGAVQRFLTVPDPRLAVLRDTPRAFLAIRIRLTEPEPGRGSTLDGVLLTED
jgi:Actinobacteria/chloroflexi VLRF1 release factor